MDPFQPVSTRKRSDLVRVLGKTSQKEHLGLPCIPPGNIETSNSRNTSFSSSSQVSQRVFLGPKDFLDLDIPCPQHSRRFPDCPSNLGYYLSYLGRQTFCSIIFHGNIGHSERRVVGLGFFSAR